jgi:hypothetical protein
MIKDKVLGIRGLGYRVLWVKGLGFGFMIWVSGFIISGLRFWGRIWVMD